jgi:arginase family enzyme
MAGSVTSALTRASTARIRRRGVEDIAAEIRDLTAGGRSYLSFDIDVIDAGHAPGTGTPEIGGMTTREAQALIRAR